MYNHGDKVVCINTKPIDEDTADWLQLNETYTVQYAMRILDGSKVLRLKEIPGVYYHAERFVDWSETYQYQHESDKEFYNDNPNYGLF